MHACSGCWRYASFESGVILYIYVCCRRAEDGFGSHAARWQSLSDDPPHPTEAVYEFWNSPLELRDEQAAKHGGGKAQDKKRTSCARGPIGLTRTGYCFFRTKPFRFQSALFINVPLQGTDMLGCPATVDEHICMHIGCSRGCELL